MPFALTQLFTIPALTGPAGPVRQLSDSPEGFRLAGVEDPVPLCDTLANEAQMRV